MPVIMPGAGGGASGKSSAKTMKAGSSVATEKITFAFKEIDFISNDGTADITVKFYDKAGTSVAGELVIKAQESLNDIDFEGGAIEFVGSTVEARYLLLG